MAENQKKIEDQQKKMVSISGSHSGAKKFNFFAQYGREIFIFNNLLYCLQAEERLAMIEEQMRIEQEKQKLKKREEKRMREEQKKILGKGNARPKLSFSLIGPADSQHSKDMGI